MHTFIPHVQVSVEAENLLGGCRRVTNTAYFTFVSLGSDHKTKPVPQLKMVSDEERSRFEEGKKRYEVRKKARMEKMQKI
jgi:acyl-coenzyme A thioesterase 7